MKSCNTIIYHLKKDKALFIKNQLNGVIKYKNIFIFNNTTDLKEQLTSLNSLPILLIFNCDQINYDLEHFINFASKNINTIVSYELNSGQKQFSVDSNLIIQRENILPEEHYDGFSSTGIYFSNNASDLLTIIKEDTIDHNNKFIKANPLSYNIDPLNTKKVPHLFLDRDGIINEDVSYLSKIEDIKIHDGIFDIVKFANEHRFPVYVITNQSGVARDKFSEKNVQEINNHIIQVFENNNLNFTGWHYCPFHFKHGVGIYKKHSVMRKPDCAMILKATFNQPFLIEKSVMIGDKKSDNIKLPGLTSLFMQRQYPLDDLSNIFSDYKAMLTKIKKIML